MKLNPNSESCWDLFFYGFMPKKLCTFATLNFVTDYD